MANDSRRLQTLRDDYLSGRSPRDELRQQIASSWQRSRLAGVDPSSVVIPYRPLSEGANSLLTEAAAPVLDRVAEQLGGDVAVLLADGDGRVLQRRVEGAGLSRRLDAMNCAPGFSFAEENVGTNGIGCVLESSGPVSIEGPEHYRDMFAGMTGFGTPLRHPVHQRLVGVLCLTCRYEKTNSLLMPLQLAISQEIQSRMFDHVSRSERIMLEEFLKVTRRSAAAVVTINRDLIIANTAASSLLTPADHAVLREWAADSITRRGEHIGEVRLSGGATLSGRVRTIAENVSAAEGVVIELRQMTDYVPVSRATRRAVISTVLPGRSVAWQRALRELTVVDRAGTNVLITGEAGTGKQRLSSMIGGPNRTTVESALAGAEQNWLEDLRYALSSSDTVTVAHIDQIPPSVEPMVAALLAKDSTARIVATAGDTSDSRLFDHFPARVSVPPLRERLEDIPDIVPALLRASGRVPAPRLQVPALQALLGRDWPGNVRELAAVVAASTLTSMGADITLADLPAQYRQADCRGALPGLKRSEREAILQALADAGGNKLVAADRLGIARSSLYRKMRALGIDAKRWS